MNIAFDGATGRSRPLIQRVRMAAAGAPSGLERFFGHGWRAAARVGTRILEDNLTSLAAASAFYALLSLFPALTALVSIYGLVANPAMVERQVTTLAGILPPEALSLLTTWLQTLVAAPPSRFGIGLLFSLLLAFWAAWSATSMLMTAVNTCYGTAERRAFVRFNRDALVLTAGLALFGLTALSLLAILPAILDLLPLPGTGREAIELVRWPLLIGIVMLALAIVYRYAPHRVARHWQWVSWGAIAATTLWVVGSLAFTAYVSTVGSYDKTYGSLGAAIVLLLWLYWTAFVILVGAEINADVERRGAAILPTEI
jgi:membrane protein